MEIFQLLCSNVPLAVMFLSKSTHLECCTDATTSKYSCTLWSHLVFSHQFMAHLIEPSDILHFSEGTAGSIKYTAARSCNELSVLQCLISAFYIPNIKTDADQWIINQNISKLYQWVFEFSLIRSTIFSFVSFQFCRSTYIVPDRTEW